MNKIFIYILTAFFLGLSFVSCEDSEVNQLDINKGFVELQYDYTVDEGGKTVSKKGLKRILVNNSMFVVKEPNSLPDSLKSRFREIELYLHTDDWKCTAQEQANGTSYVTMTLIDSIRSNDNVGSYEYKLMGKDEFIKSNPKVPVCIGLKGMMDKQNSSEYDTEFEGQITTNVKIMYLDNNVYQVQSSGIFDSNRYNLMYTGKLLKGTYQP